MDREVVGVARVRTAQAAFSWEAESIACWTFQRAELRKTNHQYGASSVPGESLNKRTWPPSFLRTEEWNQAEPLQQKNFKGECLYTVFIPPWRKQSKAVIFWCTIRIIFVHILNSVPIRKVIMWFTPCSFPSPPPRSIFSQISQTRRA